jgi:hypothetical protein
VICIWIPRYLTENSSDRYLDLGITSDRYLSILGRSDTQIYPGKLYLTPNTGKQIEAGLEQATSFLGKIVSSFTVWHEYLTPPIMFSIFILMETLAEAFKSLSGLRVHLFTGHLSPSPGLFFEKKMKENGWCLEDIQGVLHGNTSVGYFASLLPSYNSQTHPNCTDYKCEQVHKQVGEVVYQHVRSRCPGNCRVISADQSDLTKILDDDSYPAITGLSIDGDMEIQVVNARDQPYIAISHVW